MVYATNPLRKVWFWLLIISIVLLILTIVFYEIYGQTPSHSDVTTPAWIWVLGAMTILFWIGALAVYATDVAAYRKKIALLDACGLLPPPPPKKKLECPPCQERVIAEYIQQPCETKPCCDNLQPTVTKPCCDVPQPVVVTEIQTIQPQEMFLINTKTMIQSTPPPQPTVTQPTVTQPTVTPPQVPVQPLNNPPPVPLENLAPVF